MKRLPIAATIVAMPVLAYADPQLTSYVGNASPTFSCVSGDNSTAINALLANGGTVNIAAGTCSILASLKLTVTGTTLNGAGMGKTIFTTPRPLRINMIELGMAANTYRSDNLTVSNLTTDGGVTSNAGGASKVSLGIYLHGGVTQSRLTNVETERGLDGFNISGSYITATNVYSHDNRHSGFYVAGNANLSPPYDYADHDTLTGSRMLNNTLDNRSGKTWDDVDFDVRHTNGQVTYVTLQGNSDILFADHDTTRSGGDLADHNTVSGSSLSGLRFYGNLTNETATNNTVSDNTCQSTGINVVGGVKNVRLQYNKFAGVSAAGVYIIPLSGERPGDTVTVDTNDIVMCPNNNKPTVMVDAATNVHVTNNTLNGGHLDTSRAGAGLVVSGNH